MRRANSFDFSEMRLFFIAVTRFCNSEVWVKGTEDQPAVRRGESFS